MHAHFLNINNIQSRTTQWVKSGDYDINEVIIILTRQLVLGHDSWDVERSNSYEIEWVNVLLNPWYKHTRLSKVHVSGFVSSINMGLVKDRMSYALHNERELIIMQMRSKAGIRKRVMKKGGEGNPAKPGNTRRVTTRH